MANVREYIRINPIDKDNRRALGVRFPFNAEGVFYSTYTTAEQVKSNLLNVILTEPGEKLFNPFYGVGLNSLLFEQKVEANFIKEKIENAILSDSLLNSLKIEDVKVNFNRDDNLVNVKIEYISLLDGQSDAIEINYTNPKM